MQGKNPLKKFKMFKDVSHSTLDWLWHAGRVEEFKKGSLLMRAKEPIRSVCIQLTGKSMVYNLTCAGRRKIIFIFGSGVLLWDGTGLYFGQSSTYDTGVESLETVSST